MVEQSHGATRERPASGGIAMKIWIDPEHAEKLIGFAVEVFIKELSSYATVYMSPSQAMEYMSKAWADVMAVWLSDDGEIVETFASMLRSRDGLPAICVGTFSRTPVVTVDGYCGRAAGDKEGWYISIGESCYAMGEDGMIDNSKPGFCYFKGRKNQLLNLGGFDAIRRSATELCGPARDKRYGVAS